MADAPLKTCPRDLCAMKKWGRGKVKKTIGAGAGIIFKGSGFYSTDYRSENYKAAAKKESAPASGGESKTSSTEAKPSAGEGKSAPAKSETKLAKPPKPAD